MGFANNVLKAIGFLMALAFGLMTTVLFMAILIITTNGMLLTKMVAVKYVKYAIAVIIWMLITNVNHYREIVYQQIRMENAHHALVVIKLTKESVSQ